MTTKSKIAIGGVVLLTSFAAGRYSVQAPTVHTVIDTKSDKQVDSDKDTHKDTVIVTEKAPDGTTKTTTHIVEDSETKKQLEKVTDTHIDQTVTPPKTNTLNVSAILAFDFSKYQQVYGASVTKQLIGPVTIGVVGLTNGTVGGTIGLTF